MDDVEDHQFITEVTFSFSAPSLEEAGGAVRRLADAAETVGFTMRQGTVRPASDDEGQPDGWIPYAPLSD